MAIGDKKVLVTQSYADSIYDRKDNITDDVNLYDSTKKASAKAVADIEDRIEEILSTENITDEDAKLIAQLMIQKGWTDIKKVNFNESSKEFIKQIKYEFEKDNSQ